MQFYFQNNNKIGMVIVKKYQSIALKCGLFINKIDSLNLRIIYAMFV